MTHYCHIAPTPHLEDFAVYNKVHLMLAHLAENDRDYSNWYRDRKELKILDNSAFEMYKQGRPMYESDKLMDMASRTKADVIVMSDYPGENSAKTIDAAERLGPQFKAAGYQTFFVPQSKVGDMDDYLFAWNHAINSPNVDFIGMSILGVPNAFGNIEKDNKLQRFLSRWKMMHILESRGMLDNAWENGKKIHFLGALDGWLGEIKLVEQWKDYIFSWDSSGAIWLGLHGNKTYDDSPTGQIDGKYEIEVDFNFSTDDSLRILNAHDNIQKVNQL